MKINDDSNIYKISFFTNKKRVSPLSGNACENVGSHLHLSLDRDNNLDKAMILLVSSYTYFFVHGGSHVQNNIDMI